MSRIGDGIRTRWSDAGILVKGLRIVALPVIALVVSSALVLVANAERTQAHEQREAAEAVDDAVTRVRTISQQAQRAVGEGAAAQETDLLDRLLAFRGEWERALAEVETAALSEPDATLRGQVRELRTATNELLAATMALFSTAPGAQPEQDLLVRADKANTGFEAAIDAISTRAEERARAYADKYDHDSETTSRLIVVAALVGSFGAIIAMVAFAVATRRRVRLLEDNSRALGEGRALTPLPPRDDELGRLGRGLDDAAALLRDREQAVHGAAETLRQSEQRLSLALEAGAMGTWDVDLMTQACVWDAQTAIDHGVTPGAFAGTMDAWLELVHPDDRAEVMSAGAEALAAGGSWTSEYRTVAADGVRWIGTCGLALLDETGKPARLVGVCSDITERKLGEQRLRDAIEEAERANHTKNDFLSRVSHELRTPLNAILGFGQLLEMDDLTGSQRESVTQVLSGGRHLLGLIEDVLDISRIESGNLPVSIEPTAAGEVVAETMSMVSALAEQFGVTVDVEPGDWAAAHVRADRRRLKQILVNLASNGIKYNRPGGRLTFAGSSPAPGVLRIDVRDTGHGISAEMLDRLFTPFDRLGAEQSNIDGAGIGLALSQRLAEMMAATLTVETEVGTGSTFSVDVPLAEDPVTTAAIPDNGGDWAAAVGPAGTVLYVEDNPSNLKLVQRIVDRRGGIRLLSAGTGGIALSLLSRVPVDVVLLDLHLPDMSGLEVLRKLREDPHTARTPVVVVSADATPGQLDRLRAAGADEFLTKPIDLAKFLGTLDHFLSGVPAS